MANTKITNPELFNLGDSTSATQLPVMTTTERIAMNAPPTLNIDYLVVAGGGGGGRSAFTTAGSGGGGGGAGEYLYKTAQTITTGGSGYTVTVGDGGNAGISGVSAVNGGNSVFIDTTLGGGYGGTGNNSTYSPGASGGSGGGSGINSSTVYAGGSSTATSPGLGNAGGASTSASLAYGVGGGGGAGTAGSNGTSSTGGNGGTGVQNSITGTATFYAGGGGGGSFDSNNVGSGGSGVGGNANSRAAGSPGVSNTGSGGGGGSYSGSAHTNGAAGGSGVVILRYTTADVTSYTATGLIPTETTVGTDTILSFTTVGTGTITFTSSTPTGTISTGEMIFNSTTDKVEYFDGTKWYGIALFVQPPPVLATSTLYLDASNTTSYPGTGSTWFDISGNSHNGSISGPIFNSGGWFDYDGTSDVVSIPSSTVFNATSSNSVSMGGWFYMTASQLNSFWSKGSGSGSLNYEYFCFARTDQGSNNYINFNTYLSGGGQVVMNYTNSAVTNNTWYHVIVTIDTSSQSAKLYVNGGAPKATDTSFSASSVGTAPLLIGRRGDLSWDLQGRNSKFNFWSNKILTQAEGSIFV